ncbi:hypothetical protein Tco_0826989 [Tanacetum coccineum]
MVAFIISISSDSSEESVGSHALRVILFGAIPTIISVIPEVPIVPTDPIVAPKVAAVSVVSPTGVLDLVDYSSSYDPSKDSLPPVPDLPLVSPFLCSDDSEADDESEPAQVASRPSSPSGSSSHDTLAPSSEFPLAPIVSPPEILGPFPARRLAWRRVSYHSLDRHPSPDSSSSSSSDSLSDSLPVHSSGCDTSGHAHSGPSTRVAPPRFVYPPVLTQRHSEAFRHWRSAPLSTPYPPTTSESSLGSSSERSLDSSSHSAGPSRKRCRSPTALIPSSTHVSRLIAPTHADLLQPRKRFRDSYSPEDSGEEHMETGTTDAEAIAYLGIGDGVGAPTKDGLGLRVRIAASDIRKDEEEYEAEASAAGMREIDVDPLATRDMSESTGGNVPNHDTADGAVDVTYETLGDLVQRFHDHAVEILVHRIQVIESVQRFQGYRIARVDLGFTTMTERLNALEQDNVRL